MEKIKTAFGAAQFIVDPMQYSYDKVMRLSEKVAEIRRSHSLFAKYPLSEGETREAWKARIEPVMEKEMIRKEGEGAEDHLKRLFESKIDAHDMAFEIIEAIAEIFNLSKPSQEDFRASNWLKTRQFIFQVLHLGDIPCEDYYPKRLQETL